MEASLSGTDCDTECEPLLREALLVCCEPCVQFASQAIEYDWIFDNFAGEQPLGESGYENRVERHPSGSFHRPNENRSISLSGRRNADLQQKIRNHEQNVTERDRANRCHRRELGKHRQHPLWLAQCTSC